MIGRERRPRSIHHKIALTTTVIAVSSLLLACTGLIAYQFSELWRTMRRESSVVARVIGETARASLVFRDAEFAASVLEGVSSESHIVAACIYDQDGQIFATYLRQGVGPGWQFPEAPTPGYRVAAGHLLVFEEIHLEGEIVGTVLIQVDLSYLTARLGLNAIIALLVLLGASAAALLMSSRLQRKFSEPLLSLAATAHAVSERKDYSLRAKQFSDDEIGQLAVSFNEMLEGIQERDAELARRLELLNQEMHERAQAEKDLEITEEQLRRVGKMEAVGRLAGGIAHDFNNLLTVITGFSNLALGKLGLDDPLRNDLEPIHEAGEKAADLTRQLLAFSRQQVLKPRVVNLSTVVAKFENLIRRTIGEDIEIVTTLDPALGRVKADPGQIEQVLLNLAVNARDAMPQGGKLTIDTANVELDEALANKYSPMTPGRYVTLTVTDTGEGIDEETESHIFEPFYTTKAQGKGTGLGLSTVYGIVKQSDGYIWVDSEPGKGTSFKIYLPRVEEAAGRARQEEVTAQAEGGSETILVVEDEEMVRRFAVLILEAKGYQILDAEHPAQALKVCRNHEGRIDLLVTDLVMPGSSGVELAEQIAQMMPGVKTLFISGYAYKETLRDGYLEPHMEFLAKPFSPSALARRVRDILDRSSP